MLSILKKTCIVAICALSTYAAKAQKTEPLTLGLPKDKISGSLYNKITVLDLRPDTSSLGIVQEGMLNRQVKVVAKQPLQLQFDNILKSLTNESAKSGELVVQLRQLAFSELTSSFSEHGYFGFGATLYAKKGDMYLPINSIDTLAVVSAMDVTKKNIQNGSDIIAKFLSESLLKTPNATSGYIFNDLINFADVAKKALKLYNSEMYADGYYLNYRSFSNQVPDGQIVLDGIEVKPGNIKAKDAKGKLKKLKSETTYAIVYNGKPFISTPSGFYPINKSEGDLFFTGKLGNPRNNNTAAMGTMYGALGGALFGAMTTANNINPSYQVKIYYLTGDFIRLKEVK